jgi:hypothetical protein
MLNKCARTDIQTEHDTRRVSINHVLLALHEKLLLQHRLFSADTHTVLASRTL